MRDPADTAAGDALEMARHLLGILHRQNMLDPERVRVTLTEDDPMHSYVCGEIRSGEAGRALDAEAREWLLRQLRQQRAKPRRGRGRPATRSSQHFWIAQTVGRLVEAHSLTPTRNEASRDKDERASTACGLVAQALRELGVGMSERAVETIWRRRRPQDFDLGWEKALAPRRRKSV